MAKITIPNKSTGDTHSASEFNEVKASVNALYTTSQTHNPVLTFDFNKYAPAINQSAAITYSLSASGHVDGTVVRHKITSNGINTITFPAGFNVFNKSEDNIYPEGVHIFYFNYIGGDVDVVIPTYVSETTTEPTEPTGDTQAPTAPTALTSPSKTETTVNLSWTASTDNTGVTGYKIYVGGVFNKQVSTNSGQVTGLVASTPYSFTVSAIDAAGNESAQSTALSVTTSAASGATSTFGLIDFGVAATQSPAPWTNFIPKANKVEQDYVILDQNSNVMGSIKNTTYEFGTNESGHLSATNGFPVNAWSDSFYTGDSSFAAVPLTLYNLDNTKTYDIEIYSSRSGSTDSRAALITINGVEKVGLSATTPDGMGNTTPLIFTGLTPVNGQIVVSWKTNLGSTFSHINFMKLIKNA